MKSKLKKLLGFPYPAEFEAGYNRNLMTSMHKPLLVAVAAVLLFMAWLVGICIYAPDTIAPPQYISGLLAIHFTFMMFTIVTLLFCIVMRRQFYRHPAVHLAVCNIYAIGICLWASVLSAYADYSPAIYTAFIFVMLCVSMVSLFKPWLAVLAFSGNYIVYLCLLRYFSPDITDSVSKLYTATIAALVGMVISIAFYRFRARTYYDKQIIARQVEEINQINQQLRMMVHVDNLTGLLNRRFYEERLPGELAGIAAEGSFCCMMFDVDHFKIYNDTHGHLAGDECLRIVARLIREGLPPQGGFPVRYGGEEFLVLAKAPSADAAFALAEQIRAAVGGAHITNDAVLMEPITLSGGLLFCEKGETRTLPQLAKLADEALYASKESGRNKNTLYAPGTRPEI